MSGDEILYVGDHLFGDVHVSKDLLRWRTALVVRELEGEIEAAADFAADQDALTELMRDKERLDHDSALLRMERTRIRRTGAGGSVESVSKRLDGLSAQSRALDEQIAPLARRASSLGNPIWGPLMRAGNDKSLFARQVERYADVYMSRVSSLGRSLPTPTCEPPADRCLTTRGDDHRLTGY